MGIVYEYLARPSYPFTRGTSVFAVLGWCWFLAVCWSYFGKCVLRGDEGVFFVVFVDIWIVLRIGVVCEVVECGLNWNQIARNCGVLQEVRIMVRKWSLHFLLLSAVI